MPLKDGMMLPDAEVDISNTSKTNRDTCNKVLCKLGYTKDDDIRYAKIIQQVYGRLKTEENGDGNAAQQRHLYKKLTQCKDNYPEARHLPTKEECNSSTVPSSYRPQNNYYKPPPPPPQNNYYKPPPPPKGYKSEKPTPSQDVVSVAREQLGELRSFIRLQSSFQNDLDELYKKLYALDRLATETNDLIWKTNDEPFKKKMNIIRSDLINIRGKSSQVVWLWQDLITPFNSGAVAFENFFKQCDTKHRKNAPKPPKPPKTAKPPKARKGPKTAKSPTPPRKSPTPPRKSPTPPRKSPTPPRKSPTPPRKSPTPPKANSTRKRCPNGTRRNKKTGNCDPK
jgi:hypothetical protein